MAKKKAAGKKEEESASSASSKKKSRGKHSSNEGSETEAGQVTSASAAASASYNSGWPQGTAKFLDEAEVKEASELEHEGTLCGKKGRSGSGKGRFNHPCHIAIDRNDNAVVADFFNCRAQVISSAGAVVRVFGRKGDGELQGPTGVAIDSDHSIHVVDVGNRRVQVFSEEGAFVRKYGSRRSRSCQLKDPQGIAISKRDGCAYVADKNKRIQVYSSTGEHVQTIGQGEIHFPTGVALDEDDNIFASCFQAENSSEDEDDEELSEVVVFSKSGDLIRRFGQHGDADSDLHYPRSICYDHHRGNIVVGDFKGVKIFSKDGNFICKLPGPDFPASGVAVDSTGRVLASDYADYTIERWS